MKRKLFFWAKKKINSENIRFVVLLIPMIIILIQNIATDGLDLSSLLDTNILISFMLVALCDVIAHMLLNVIQKKCEDESKLDTKYSDLVSKYSLNNLIEYQGDKFPVVCQHLRKRDISWKIEINDDPENRYELPSQVADLSGEIMEAHSQSVVYNQIYVRLNDTSWNQDTSILTFYTGRTFYYDSLLTNRAADYKLSNGKTIREIYEPGPYIQSLQQTKMSNHLGFNGFLEMNDGKIPFVVRGDNVSIGKGTLANSIGAAMKSKYAIEYEHDYRFTCNGLGNAILKEIVDELALCPANQANEYFQEHGITSSDAVNSIFAIYRDLVECGKPQFLFFMKFDFLSSEELQKIFNSKNKEKIIKKEDKVKRDGKKLIFFTLEQLKSAKITADKLKITMNGAEYSYTMMPSASASIVMLLEYLK